MSDHPLPLGLRVRNYGQQYPEARQGTATIVEIARGPFTVQGTEGLYEYVVQVDREHDNGVVRLREWSSGATIPAVYPDGFSHDIEALGARLARCTCKWIGRDDEPAAQHARAYGMCGTCWGGGTDAYPSLGTCGICGGSGTAEDETQGLAVAEQMAADADRYEAEQAAAEAEADEALEAQERFEMDGGTAFYAPQEG